MATASPSALPAVTDRLIAVRPETKEPGHTDGQFAGLMACLAVPPAQARVPGPIPDGPTKGVGGQKGQSPKNTMSGKPSTLAPSAPQSPQADSAAPVVAATAAGAHQPIRAHHDSR